MQAAVAAKVNKALEQKFLEVTPRTLRFILIFVFVVVTRLQEQVYAKNMFNERADAMERVAALQEEMQQLRMQADVNQKQALKQEEEGKQRLSALEEECTALKARISSAEHDANQLKEQSAASLAASTASSTARIAELESEKSAAVAAVQQQVPCAALHLSVVF